MSSRRLAILALQGDFAEHAQSLRALGVETCELRQARDLDQDFDGLILPGGESTVISKLLRELEMFSPLQRRLTQEQLPVFATCAGLILLAKHLQDEPSAHLATLDVNVVRNAYGRQLGSFFTCGKFAELEQVPMSFIRAPAIEQVGEKVTVLASYQGRPTAVRQERQLAMAFHPELLGDTRIYRYFLEEMVR